MEEIKEVDQGDSDVKVASNHSYSYHGTNR